MATNLSSVNTSLLRLSGLSSNLDTESIITNLMKVEQLKVDKQFKAVTKLEWKSQALRDTNLLLKNFRQENMSLLKSASNMLSSSTYNIYKATMQDSTNAVTVSANSQATAGTITIDSITQLATAAQIKGSAVSSSELLMSTALKDLDLTNRLQFESGSISFSINGQTFSFGEDALLSDVISTVNSNSDAGVTMSYSSLKKSFTLTAKTTGSSSSVNIVNITGNAFADSNSAFGIAQQSKSGQNAILSIEGVNVEKSSNTFTIDGITYTLKDELASSVSFSVGRDIESTITKIKSFIDSYNTLIGTLQSKINEEVYSDYTPLTDTEREKLSESQATKWEEKAKSGILRNDRSISNFLSKIRSAFYTTVEGTGKTAADIGLRTGSYTDSGKIVIDEEALRTALENNPNEVEKIFISTSTSTDATTKFNESGLITRISNSITSYIDTTTSITLVNNDDALEEANERLDLLSNRMSAQEEKYWAKFTAMETALSKLNSQSSWLSTQISSMGA